MKLSVDLTDENMHKGKYEIKVLSELDNGNKIVAAGKAYFMLNKEDENILGNIYSGIYNLRESYAGKIVPGFYVVRGMDGYSNGLIDENGHMILQLEYSEIYGSNYYKGLYIMTRLRDANISFMYNGKMHNQWYSRLDRFNNDGYASVRNSRNNWGVINLRGELVIPFEYKMLSCPCDGGLIVAEKIIDGKCRYGYIGLNTEEILPFQYEIAHSFHQGFAKVKFPDSLSWNVIDIHGNVVADLDNFRSEIPEEISIHPINPIPNPISIEDSIKLYDELEYRKRQIQEMIGKSFITEEEFEIGFLISYSLPYTGSSKILIPKGVLLEGLRQMNDSCFYCKCNNGELYRLAHEQAKSVTLNKYLNCLGGICFFVTYEQLLSSCKEIK